LKITTLKVQKKYASHRKWVDKNREKFLEYHREYNRRPEAKKRRRELRKKNLDKYRAVDNAHYARNRDRHRELSMAKRYNFSVEYYRELFVKHNNLCAICHKPEKSLDRRNNRIRWLSVDHCHKTNKVRGLLCQNCNQAIGLIHEDVSILNKIKKYLEQK